MKKKYLLRTAFVALSAAMLSCSSSDATDNGDNSKRIVNMLSEPHPIQLTEAQRTFVGDNNQFAQNFLKAVNDVEAPDRSFIYSPLSITYVLGMVNDAATGQTEQELEQTLGFHEGGIQAVNAYCQKLIDGLPKVDPSVTLRMANAIFLNRDYTLKPAFQQDMQTYYDAKAEALDFSSPQTLDRINGWCNDKTNGMIPKILDSVNPAMVSYLLNAIYFKADWTSQFDPKNTKTEPFSTGNGQTPMPMMHQDVLISYLKNDTFSAVIIPYGSGLWNMTVLLPEAGKTTDDVINHVLSNSYVLNPRGWCSIADANIFQGYEVDLKLPRFATSSDTNQLDIQGGLSGVMQKMGIRMAFDRRFADIPNMCNRPVYIGMMRQKAKIEVNEKGAEAAAVTVAGMTNSVGPATYPKADFHANRPFVYVISEQSSGAILFVGKFIGE